MPFSTSSASTSIFTWSSVAALPFKNVAIDILRAEDLILLRADLSSSFLRRKVSMILLLPAPYGPVNAIFLTFLFWNAQFNASMYSSPLSTLSVGVKSLYSE